MFTFSFVLTHTRLSNKYKNNDKETSFFLFILILLSLVVNAYYAKIDNVKVLCSNVVNNQKNEINEGDDVTYLLMNSDFSNGQTGWTIVSNGGGNVQSTAGTFEAWHSTNFDVYQELQNLPLGVYEIRVQGYVRYLDGQEAINAKGNTPEDIPIYVYMNDSKTRLANWFDFPQEPGFFGEVDGAAFLSDSEGYEFPDNSIAANAVFEKGYYTQSVFGLVAKHGDVLRVGVKGNPSTAQFWPCFDNFKLKYYGLKVDYIGSILNKALEKISLDKPMGKTVYEIVRALNAMAADAIHSNDCETMLHILNNICDVINAVSTSVCLFSELNAANEVFQESINNAINQYEATKAQNLHDQIAYGITNHVYDDEDVTSLLDEIKEMACRISRPNMVDGIYYDFNQASSTAVVIGYCKSPFDNSIVDTENIFLPTQVTYDEITFTVTSIGDYAFSDCCNLTTINISNSVTNIGHHAFEGCTGLTSVSIPNSVTSIGEGAFCDCTSLISVTIPNSVKYINCSTFDGCSSLVSVNIPNGVTTIELYAFRDCSKLASVTLPDGLTTIGSYAFQRCRNLSSIVIPRSVTTVGDAPFSGCRGLSNVTVNCPEMGAWFSGLNGISLIKLGEGVQVVGDNAFNGCSNVKTIDIGSTVTTIGKRAFGGSDELMRVICHAVSVPQTQRTAFEGSYVDYADLYVPAVSLEDYRTTAPWSGFFNKFPFTDDLTVTGVTDVRADSLLIKSSNGQITVTGIDEGTSITVYDLLGKRVGNSVVCNGTATVNTTLQTGSVAIVKIGEKSVKVMIK